MLRASIVAALALPSTALAGPFGEPPLRPANGSSWCLAATGPPGELVRHDFAEIQFLRASADGLTVSERMALAEDQGCATAATNAAGGGVIVTRARDRLRARSRDPGQGWGEPVELGFGESAAVALADRGDALVAFLSIGPDESSVQVSRRMAGMRFGAVTGLATTRASYGEGMRVLTGLSEAGEAIVAWTQPRGRRLELWVAEALAGEPFRAPRRFASSLTSAEYDLAVGHDGRVLLAFNADDRLHLVEREPTGTWSAPTPVAEAGGTPAVALGDGDAAVVAWTGFIDLSVHARTRSGPGAFLSERRLGEGLGRARGLGGYFGMLRDNFAVDWIAAISYSDLDDSAAPADAAILPDGRALVTWSGAERRAGDASPQPHAALLGATTETYALGAGIRLPHRPVPLVTGAGAPAVAWGDRSTDDDRRAIMHVAVAGVPDTADPPAPKVTIGQPRWSAFDKDDPLVLPVTCSAACDVRAHVAGRFEPQRALQLPRAGTGELVIDPKLEAVAPAQAAPVRILIRYGAPGARTAKTRAISRALRRRSSAPAPRPRGLTARRDGNRVLVHWRSWVATVPERFAVVGRDRAGRAVTFNFPGLGGPKRREFTFRLRDPARKVVSVTVYSTGDYVTSLRGTETRVR